MPFEPPDPPPVYALAPPSDGLVFSSWVTFDDYVSASRALRDRWSTGMTFACTSLGAFAVLLALFRARDQVVFQSRRGGGLFINRRNVQIEDLRPVIAFARQNGVAVEGAL